jgi:hypothetical protein
MRGGGRCLDECFSRVSGQPLKGGSSMVLQTHGRHGQDTPHLHGMATRGGGDQRAKQWVHLEYVQGPKTSNGSKAFGRLKPLEAFCSTDVSLSPHTILPRFSWGKIGSHSPPQPPVFFEDIASFCELIFLPDGLACHALIQV